MCVHEHIEFWTHRAYARCVCKKIVEHTMGILWVIVGHTVGILCADTYAIYVYIKRFLTVNVVVAIIIAIMCTTPHYMQWSTRARGMPRLAQSLRRHAYPSPHR